MMHRLLDEGEAMSMTWTMIMSGAVPILQESCLGGGSEEPHGDQRDLHVQDV